MSLGYPLPNLAVQFLQLAEPLGLRPLCRDGPFEDTVQPPLTPWTRCCPGIPVGRLSERMGVLQVGYDLASRQSSPCHGTPSQRDGLFASVPLTVRRSDFLSSHIGPKTFSA